MDTIQEFCGLNKTASYVTWLSETSNFSDCFLWMVPSNVAHGIFIVCCAYLCGLSSKKSEGFTNRSKGHYVKTILSLLLLTTCVLELILSYAIGNRTVPAYMLAKTIAIFAWFIHFIMEHQRYPTFSLQHRKRCLVFLGSVLIFIVSILEVYTDIKNIIHYNKDIQTWSVQYFGTFVYGVFVLLFVISCAVSCKRYPVSYILFRDWDGNPNKFIKQQDAGHLLPKYQELDDSSGSVASSLVEWKRDTPNILSRLTLWWVNDIINRGNQDELNTTNDLFDLPNNLRTHFLRTKFSTILKKERAIQFFEQRRLPKESLHKRRSLLSILSRTYHGKVYCSLIILKLLMIALNFCGPIILNYLINFMENKNEPIEHGYYYVAALFSTSTLEILVTAHYRYYLELVRVYLRGTLMTSIYDKTLKVNSSTLYSRFTTGQIINFMTTDVDRIVLSSYYFLQLWGLPIQLVVCTYLLYNQVGISVLASCGVVLFFSPITWVVTLKMKKYVARVMKWKDERIKVTAEILNGIRVIKFYAWEEHFEKVVGEVRDKEMQVMRVFKYLQAMVTYLWVASPYIMCLFTFLTYSLLGNKVTAATVFTTMSLLSILNNPFNDLPWSISSVTNAWISLKRLDVFLSMPEIDEDVHFIETSTDDVFELKHGVYEWKDETAEIDVAKIKNLESKKKTKKKQEKENDLETEKENIVPFVLRNINLTIKKGSFVGMTGKVGSGKSSLFAALTSEMRKQSGLLCVDEDINGFAYVAQEPWIQNLTVKENILYGKPCDQERYEKVLYACALVDDLKTLPAGDMTEIGENGINLSGGQKSRVAFARAVYQDKDVYLMDDPLSAVDSHVASHLFNHCILGLLKDKTRILSTHHIKFLHSTDTVILMKDGNIIENGEPKEVLANDEVMQLEQEIDSEDTNEEFHEENTSNKNKDSGKLVIEEERNKGAVGLKVYNYYFQQLGMAAAITMVLFLAVAKTSKYTADWWMAEWTSQLQIPPSTSNTTSYSNATKLYPFYGYETPAATIGFYHDRKHTIKPLFPNYDDAMYEPEEHLTYYLGIYCGLMISGSFGTLIRTLANACGSVRASCRIHKELFHSILSAPIAFFDITPIGRLTNRFSSDMNAVDSVCAFLIQVTISIAMTIIISVIMACYSVPWFTVIVLPLGAIYYFIQNLYRKSSRELKRLSSITRSPIYTHFSETLSGAMIIRAFRDVPRFIETNEKRLEANQKAYFSTQVVEIWLVLRLGGLSILMLTAVSFLAVLEHHYQNINPGLVGLAVSISLRVQRFFMRLVTDFTRLEKAMVNTERVLHYTTHTVPEAIGISQVPDGWPMKGAISFQNVSLRYREDLPLVIEDLSMDISAGEKIGICGRTGSGKSSLFRMLFKTAEFTSGEIIIDHVYIRHALTEKIRSGMSIIPQDPFLFDDTVSQNLDPKSQYTDEERLDVIKKCHLTKAVEELGGLNGHVGEHGNKLSAGQKQLICLARALLKKSKVICIDEATASVDLATDNLIQSTIRKEFVDSTVLTIAHRLDTIIDSDRVLVMDYGKIAEFSQPTELLSNPNSLFSLLVQKDRQRAKKSK